MKKPRIVRDFGFWCCYSEHHWLKGFLLGCSFEGIAHGTTPAEAYRKWREQVG